MPRRALVLGGGGALGAAVLEQLLASHRFERVGVLAQRALQPALRGLEVVPDGDAAALATPESQSRFVIVSDDEAMPTPQKPKKPIE